MRAGSSIELAAWVLGVALLGCYGAARVSFEMARAAGVEDYREASATHARAPEEAAGSAPAPPATFNPDQSLWSAQRIKAFWRQDANREPAHGLLRIPVLQLEVPIYSGATESNLDRGAAHIEGTALLSDGGNAGIAAHRDGFFRKLKDISIDNELHVDVDGRVLTYRVVDLSVVEPHDISVLAPTATPSVTLVTCFPFYFVGTAPRRYIVRAELVHEVAASGSPPEVASAQRHRPQTTRTPATQRNKT